MSPDELVSLRTTVAAHKEEIGRLREHYHTLVQKPNSDGLRMQAMEGQLKQILEGNTSQSRAIDKVLITLNGDDDRPGIKGRLAHVEQLAETTQRLVETIDGTPSMPGHSGRLDRLDRTVSIYVRVTWMVGGAIITALVGGVIALVRYGH